tara:strand:- start:189 stop:599 length:411 start_codon:yes stop_codon:yes gene_type:complete
MYLENTLGLTASEQQATGLRGTNQGGMLKGINYWAAPNTWATNSSGFNAIPSGRFNHSSAFSNQVINPEIYLYCNDNYIPYYTYNFTTTPYFYGLNYSTEWWSIDGYTWSLTNSSGQIERSTSSGYNYKSVRCLKD